MTLAELLALLGLTTSAEIEKAIGDYVIAQTTGLKKNRDQLFNDKKKLQETVDAFAGLDASELADALAEANIEIGDVIERIKAKPDASKPDVAKQIADAVAAAEAKAARKIALAEKKAQDAEAKVATSDKARIDDAITTELTQRITEAKGNVDLLSPMLRGRIKGAIDPDTGKVVLTPLAANGDEMVASGGQVATVLTLVETIKGEDKFGAAFEAEGGGSGSGGNKNRNQPTGKNPWLKGAGFNRTEQARINAANPALATQYKAAAERQNAAA